MRVLSWGLAKKILAQPCILSTPKYSIHIPSRAAHTDTYSSQSTATSRLMSGRQAHSRQDKEHGDQPSTGNTGCTNAGQCGREAVRTKRSGQRKRK